jgi:hypothetical protein
MISDEEMARVRAAIERSHDFRAILTDRLNAATQRFRGKPLPPDRLEEVMRVLRMSAAAATAEFDLDDPHIRVDYIETRLALVVQVQGLLSGVRFSSMLTIQLNEQEAHHV